MSKVQRGSSSGDKTYRRKFAQKLQCDCIVAMHFVSRNSWFSQQSSVLQHNRTFQKIGAKKFREQKKQIQLVGKTDQLNLFFSLNFYQLRCIASVKLQL